MEPTRKYTQHEKNQLLANLDIEVEHRVRQFEAWLADTLENFRIHQEGLISRVPKLVRGLTMREFGEKYAGDVQAALRGIQREKMGGAEAVGEIDKTTRKRKWVASQETEAASTDMEGSKSVKNARTMSTSPKKKAGSSTGPGTTQRAHLIAAKKTLSTSRTMGRIPASPSPTKPPRQFQHHSTTTSHPYISPSKPNRATRPPSLATFNPALPKTPGFPNTHNNNHPKIRNGTTTARIPRRHESMLSINGSPLANPYELGLEWFAEGGDADADDDAGDDSADGAEGRGERDNDRRKRAKSIIIRRDPSFSLQSAPMPMSNDLHSRTTSQSSLFPSSSQPSNPHSTPSRPTTNGTTRLPPRTGTVTALVTIPTKDGHLLEFDPLQTSPGTLDALEGISDSAKKQAREEMARLVQAAVNMWKIA